MTHEKDQGWEVFSKNRMFDDVSDEIMAKHAWNSSREFYRKNPQFLAEGAKPNLDTVLKTLELAGKSVDAATVEFLTAAWPIVIDEKVKAAQRKEDALLDTLIAIGGHLGIDYKAVRALPGKPSEVFIAAIERRATKQKAQATRSPEHGVFSSIWANLKNRGRL